MTKEKDTTRKERVFQGAVAYSVNPVAGVSLYGDKKAEPTVKDVLDEMEKDEILSARKDALLRKLKERSEPNPKRYTVDPETGKIDIDEEGGEYNQKDAMMISASIKGRGGQYDAAIALITAAKALVSDNQPSVAEKPREFYVDPETGIIVRDPENGEYTLSEARTISQSLKKEKQAAQPSQGQKSFLEKVDEVTDGLVTKKIASMFGGDTPQQRANPIDDIANTVGQVEKIRQLFAPGGGGGAQVLAQSGIRGELLKLLLEDERERLKMGYDHETQVERNKALGSLASTVKDNWSDGVKALVAAVEEAQGRGVSKEAPAAQPAAPPMVYECGECHTKFGIPNVPFVTVTCPNPECGKVYTKEEITS